jgi:hypothetical protein
MVEIPTPNQSLRASISVGRCDFIEIFGPVDVARNTREFENNAGKSSCLGCGEMRQEAIVPKTQRK